MKTLKQRQLTLPFKQLCLAALSASISWSSAATTNVIPITGAPGPRYSHTAVWTGTEMIIWGGQSGTSVYGDGARYNPVTQIWSAVNSTGAPAARTAHTAIWTGSEMIIFGGWNRSSHFNDGARYNPTTNVWTPLPTLNAPASRKWHDAVWTGSKMIIFGGEQGFPTYPNGAIWDLTTNAWSALTTTGAPANRAFPRAVWTGNEMFIWGGDNGYYRMAQGGLYNPLTNTWRLAATAGQPNPADETAKGMAANSSVWTGTKIIVFGGVFGTGNSNNPGGGIFDPGTNAWSPLANITTGVARRHHAAVWTGNKMFTWGGYDGSGSAIPQNDGGFYTLTSNTWEAAANAPSPSQPRAQHSIIWTGTAALVWGGNTVSEFGSDAATNTGFSVLLAPTITAQPASITAYANQSATISVIAVGTGIINYQWRKNGVNIPTATSSSLTLSPLNYRSVGSYDVVVTDEAGSVMSESAELTVLSPAPNVAISPGDTTVALGGNLTFTATVGTGIPPFTYQWRRNNVLIAKATNPTLVLTNIQRTQEGVYDVVVKNAHGVDVSNPVRLSLTPLVPIDAAPESVDVNLADTASFTVDVPGATAWQWLKNGVPIKGATSSTLTVPNVDASSVGLYSVTVTTPAGKVTTPAAQLRVTDSGLLIYKLTGTGKAYAGTVATNAALSGYLVLDRAGQRGGLIIGSKSGSQNIHRLEIHDDLDTQSTGPVPKSQTVVSELVAGEFALWMDGTDGLLTISKTDKAVGPATMKGSANSIDLGSNVRIETVSLTLTLDAVNSTPARLNQETVEQAMSRISQDMQAKGSALVE